MRGDPGGAAAPPGYRACGLLAPGRLRGRFPKREITEHDIVAKSLNPRRRDSRGGCRPPGPSRISASGDFFFRLS